ncbi:MAG: hypothetical protein M0C28_42280 [Candidatus Moduliflexus flocculans]|nr:hypothetical protein [Candidatus Moduliflexus flocculans]
MVSGRGGGRQGRRAASPTTRSPPTASGPCSAPAATSSPSRRKYGNTRNLTADARHPRARVPNGRPTAGLDRLHLRPERRGRDLASRTRTGRASRAQLTPGGDTYKYQIRWSPDGTKILWNDKMLRLSVRRRRDPRRSRSSATAEAGEIGQFAWSPDSRWIAYGQARDRRPDPRSISIRSIRKKTFPVTDSWYDSNDPAFSRRRQVPLLRLRPGLQPRLQRDRVRTTPTWPCPGSIS